MTEYQEKQAKGALFVGILLGFGTGFIVGGLTGSFFIGLGTIIFSSLLWFFLIMMIVL